MAQSIVYYAAVTVMVQAAMASFKCPVLQNQALIPDPSDCRKYYHCLPGGRVFPMQCPNGLVFDTRQKVCIWDSTAKSCAPDTELPSLPQHQSSHTTKTPATKGGHSRPKASKMTAPDPPKNIISTARRNKDVQETQERRKPVLTTPATTHSSAPTSTTASTTSTTTSTTTTTETFSTEAKSTTSSKGAELEKQFSDAVDVINSLLSRVGPETASQAQHPASGTPLPLTTTTASSTLQGDNSAADTSVSGADKSDKPQEGDNPSSSSPLLKEEDKGAHSVHRRSPDNKGFGNYLSEDVRCPSGFAYMPDPSNCGTFYHCYNWQPMKKMCPPGLFFDHQTYVCNWPHNVNCIEGYRAKTLYSFNNFRRDHAEVRETTARIPKDLKEKTLKPSTARTTVPTTTTTTTTTTELPTSRTTSAEITTQPLTSRSESANTESTRVLFEGLDSVSTTTYEVPHESVTQRLDSKISSTQNLLESSPLTDQPESDNGKDTSSSLSRSSLQVTDTTAWSRVSDLPLETEHVLAELYANNDDLKKNVSSSDEASDDSLASSTSTGATTRLEENSSTAAPPDTSVATASGAPDSSSVQTSAASILSSLSDSHTPPAAQHQSTPPGDEGSNTSAPLPAQTSSSSFVSLAADNATTTMPPPNPVTRDTTTPLSAMAARVPFYAMDSRHAGSSRTATSNTAYHRGSRLRARTHVPQAQSMSVSPYMPAAMAVSPFRTPAAQEFHSYDDVQIEKFMIKLLNDAMRSRHVVSRDVSDTTSDAITSSGLTGEPTTWSAGNTSDGDRKHPPTTHDVKNMKAEADIEEVNEDDSYVHEEVAPSTLFFQLPGNGQDFGTSTLQQDMHVSGVSDMEPQPYRQTLPLQADDQGTFSKKTASFPFAARDADSKEFDNLVEHDALRENAKAKYLYDEQTMKAESQAMTGLDDKVEEWDVKSGDLGLQMGYAYPKIYSNLGDEVDLSGDGETPEMTNHIPKIQAFSGILALEEQTNSSSNDPSQNETDDGIPASTTTQDVSVQEDGAASPSTPAVDTTQQTTLVTHNQQDINLTDYNQSTSSPSVGDLSKIVPTDTNQTNRVASKVSADMSSSRLPPQSTSADSNVTESSGQSSSTQALTADSTSTAKVEETQAVDNSTSTTSVVNNTDDTAADGTTANELLSPSSDNTSLTQPASSLRHTDNSSLSLSPLQHTDNSSLSVSPLQHSDNSSLSVSSLRHTDNSSLSVSPLENPGNSSVIETSGENHGNASLTQSASSQEGSSNISLTPSDKANVTSSPALSTSLLEDDNQTSSPESTTARSSDSSDISRESSTVMSDTHSSTSTSSDSSTTTPSSDASSKAPESSVQPSIVVTTASPDHPSNTTLSDSTQKAEVFKAKNLDNVADNTTEGAEAEEVQVAVGDVSKGQQEGEDADDTVAPPTNASSDIHGATALLHTSGVEPQQNETAMLLSNNETAMLPSNNESIVAQPAAADDAAPDTDKSTTDVSRTNNSTITDSDTNSSTRATFDTNSSTTAASDTHSSPTATSDTNSAPTTAGVSSESPEISANNISSIVNASVYSAAELEDRVISEDIKDADSSTSVWRLAEGTGAPQEEQTVLLTATKLESETNDSTSHNATDQGPVQDSVSSSTRVVSLDPSLSPIIDEFPTVDRQLGDNDTQTVSSVDATVVQKVLIDSAPYSGLINVSMSEQENIDDNTTSVNTSPASDITEDSIIENNTEVNASQAVELVPVAYLSDETLIKSSGNELLETKSEDTNIFHTKDSSSLLSEGEVVGEVQQVHESENHSDLTAADNNDHETASGTKGDEASVSLEETLGQEQTTVAESKTNMSSEGADLTTTTTLSSSPESLSDDSGSIATEKVIPGEGNERPHTSDNVISHQHNISASAVVVDEKSDGIVEETREDEDARAHDADKMVAADVERADAADDAEAVGVKRSFVSLTDLITWYLKHWRNYTRWRQEHTTLPSSTPEP